MGYDLHLTRADHWPDSAMYPISLEEWVAVADAEPRMAKHQDAGKYPCYAYTNVDGLTWALDWREGSVTVWKGEADATLTRLAEKLGARLVGDDSEEYHADGTHTDWSEPRPTLFERPLDAYEAQAAWQMIFDRTFDDGGFSWRPGPGHAGHALSAFRILAAREVAAADVPDADGLLYQYGLFGSRETVFSMSFVRQVATGAEGGLTQIECCLDFAMAQNLAGLGRHDEWWFPSHGRSRDEWFDGLAARPEWQLLNTVTPSRISFNHDELC